MYFVIFIFVQFKLQVLANFQGIYKNVSSMKKKKITKNLRYNRTKPQMNSYKKYNS